jgi:acyl transferase domain-containing protein/Zn-dependent alcohol dehydrogenase/NAD(P)-dependent dehydrogenase (short-subunit alcohol dehydrogenase family)/acyl carrier protein
MEEVKGLSHETIAILGMGCRVPGADDPDSLWEMVADRRESVTPYPGGRTSELDAFYRRSGRNDGPASIRGGFLPEIDKFDAAFFEISPREAEWMDPQQRLLLELAWETLEDAGTPLRVLKKEKSGVFVGVWINDYEQHAIVSAPLTDFFLITGSLLYAASGRLAYQFDLAGPDISVNAACGSSLVAIHLAVRSLRSGECSIALAGGVNIIARPEITQGFSRAKMLSPDGRCKFGDASADGFVRSDGGGMLLLKRLPDALRDGDRILALIPGTAMTNDGRASGFMTTPSAAGQRQAMLDAVADARIEAASIDFVEAHGTGTSAGDPVEIAAIASVFGRSRTGTPCRMASVKSNIGHTESAAGVIGVIRTVQAFRQQKFPATLHVQEPNPAIDWVTAGVTLELEGSAWEKPDGTPRRASVNGLGLTGTNAHIILEEFPQAPALTAEPRDAYMLPFSAASDAALQQHAKQMSAALAKMGSLANHAGALNDFCYTASVRRNHLGHRAAVVGSNSVELRAQLDEFIREHDTASKGATAHGAKPRIAFVFPGQGSQWVGMGRELLRSNAAFRHAMEEIDRAIRQESGWSVIDQLEDVSLEHRLGRIDIVQPTLFAIEVALASVWVCWGIVPDAVVGHSMGEVAAAHVAGILTLEDAVKIICRRSALLTRVAGSGAMVVVDLPSDEAQRLLSGQENKVSIAVCNSPRSTVLAGDPTALNEIVESLELREIFCRWVRVDVASHSPQMDPLLGDLARALADVQAGPGSIPMCSTVRLGMSDPEAMDGTYWVENLRQPVLFAHAVEDLLQRGFNTFLEMSPHPALVPFVEQTASQSGRTATALGSLRREEPEFPTLLAALGRIYCAGAEIDWQRIYPVGNLIKLPPYPWQRERFWIEPSSARVAGLPSAAGHPLMAEPIQSATGDWIWSTLLSVDMHPWFRDHVVEDATLFPASAYLEMAAAAAQTVFKGRSAQVEKLRLLQAATVPAEGAMELQAVATFYSTDRYGLKFFWRESSAEEWTQTAECLLNSNTAEDPCKTLLTDWEDAEFSPHTSSGRQHAATMKELGYNFGPSFCRIDWLSLEGTTGLARIEVSAELQQEKYLLHPAVLDAALQLLVRLSVANNGNQTLLPVAMGVAKWTAEQITGERAGITTIYARATMDDHALQGDVAILDAEGNLLWTIQGLEFSPLEPPIQPMEKSLFQVDWEKLDAREIGVPDASPGQSAGRCLLVGNPAGVATELAVALQRLGVSATIVEADEFLCSDRMEGDAVRVVVWLSPLGLDSGATLAEAQQLLAETAAVVSKLSEFPGDTFAGARLWTVTRGAQPAGGEPVTNVLGAGVWGLIASVVNEYPELQASCVDLPSQPLTEEMDQLTTLLLKSPKETRVALRKNGYFAARLNRFDASSKDAAEASATPLRSAGLTESESFQLSQSKPGELESFELISAWRHLPEDGEVEIAVDSAGINFKDILRLVGLHESLAASQIGFECSGIVQRVGQGVTRFRPGDAVLAISPSIKTTGMFASHVRVPEGLAAKMPIGMSSSQAAGIPCVFLTAWYGLVKLARLQKGERVLIHAAAGGVGLAAIQIAQWSGAEIYATVSSAEKREYLQSLGVTRIMHSRKLDFAREVLESTNGKGVDVVLNSLTGAAIPAGLEALAPYGRFVEIGKRDMWENSLIGLEPFQKNLSLFAVDLSDAVESRRGMVVEMLAEIMNLFESGVLQPDPTTSFPVSAAADAFRLMASGGHIGKIVLDMRENTAENAPKIRRDLSRLAPDATYWITGGLGALGLIAAQTLVERGARHLVLTSRRAPSEETLHILRELETGGISIAIRQADVGIDAEVGALLEEMRATMPPLRGIVHAAGILDDAVVSRLSLDRFESVMAGKVAGALAIDARLHCLDLDFLVYYSSAAGTLGNPGQANYAAANTILDALAHNQRTRGIPAIAIDWGTWSEIGLAAVEDIRGTRIASQGLKPISPVTGATLFESVLRDSPTQVAAMNFSAIQWCKSHPAAANSGLFKNLTVNNAIAGQENGDLLVRLNSLDGVHLHAALIAWLREQVAAVLRLNVEQVLEDKPLRSLGLDSLMALELRNRLERGLQLRLSATLVWNYPTVSAVASYLETRVSQRLSKETVEKAESLETSRTVTLPSGQPEPAGRSAAEMLAAELMEIESLLTHGEGA